MTEAIFKLREARPGELGFFPVDEEGAELMHSVKPVGRDVSMEVIQRRNPKHHRLAFAIFKFLQYHSDTFHDVPIDRIKDAVKLATGLVDTFVKQDTGEAYYVLKSISFAAMDQTKFNEFFDAAVKVIAERYMPEGTTPEAVRKELFAMVDGPGALGSRVA